MMQNRSGWLVLAFVALATWPMTAAAASVTIVALGTSNTAGPAVPSEYTYPAQLQAALAANGVSAQVINMGEIGDSSEQVLARAASVPDGTTLVVYEYAPFNDKKKGVTNGAANMAALNQLLAARGIRSIEITAAVMAEYRRAVPADMTVVYYGVPHLNGDAYAELVKAILPRVQSALSN